MNLTDLNSFVAVVDHGTMSAAAQAEGVPKSTISRRIARLEEVLGVQLLTRSSRSFVVTPQGRLLHMRAKPALQSLVDVRTSLLEGSDEPRGVLVLTAPQDLARSWFFIELLLAYRARYPAVHIDARLESRYVDLVAEGIDVALRGHGTWVPGDPTLKVKSLGRTKLGLFASPAYLKRRTTPTTLDDLAGHDLVAHSSVTRRPLTVRSAAGPASLDFMGAALVVNDMWLVHTLAISDAGIGWLPVPEFEHADDPQLVRVLPQWWLPFGKLSLVWPDAKYLAPRVRAFIDLASNHLASHFDTTQ